MISAGNVSGILDDDVYGNGSEALENISFATAAPTLFLPTLKTVHLTNIAWSDFAKGIVDTENETDITLYGFANVTMNMANVTNVKMANVTNVAAGMVNVTNATWTHLSNTSIVMADVTHITWTNFANATVNMTNVTHRTWASYDNVTAVGETPATTTLTTFYPSTLTTGTITTSMTTAAAMWVYGELTLMTVGSVTKGQMEAAVLATLTAELPGLWVTGVVAALSRRLRQQMRRLAGTMSWSITFEILVAATEVASIHRETASLGSGGSFETKLSAELISAGASVTSLRVMNASIAETEPKKRAASTVVAVESSSVPLHVIIGATAAIVVSLVAVAIWFYYRWQQSVESAEKTKVHEVENDSENTNLEFNLVV